MLARDPTDGLQSRFTFIRQVQRITAAVAFMRTSFQEPLGFEFSTIATRRLGSVPKSSRQRLLSNRRICRQNPENACVCGHEFQNREAFRKP